MDTNKCDGNFSYFGLTAVRYESNDIFGIPMALLTLSPVFLVVAFVTLLLSRCFELQIAALGIGIMIDLGINIALKGFLHEPRPISLCANQGSGMPSHHAEFMFFFSTWCLLFLSNRVECKAFIRFIVSSALILWPLVVAYSRFYLECHTSRQVIVGALLGSGFGSLYYLICDIFFLCRRPIVKSLQIQRHTLFKHL